MRGGRGVKKCELCDNNINNCPPVCPSVPSKDTCIQGARAVGGGGVSKLYVRPPAEVEPPACLVWSWIYAWRDDVYAQELG